VAANDFRARPGPGVVLRTRQYRLNIPLGMIAKRWTPRSGYVLELIAVAAVYYVAAQLGLRLALVDNDVTPLWPPTGVAVVALLARG
jgi:hypothetical protein